MTRMLQSIALGCLAIAGCQRSDNSTPVEPLSGPKSNVERTAPLAQPTPTCVVPLADVAPPMAEPAQHCPPSPEVAVPLRHGTLRFLGGAQPVIDVELALTEPEQQRGLMYRTTLGAESGMLFSWQTEQVHTFWMRNTCIPLDMLFIAADGTIVGILEQVPVLNEETRSVPCPAAHVLEVNAGYCRKHGIAPGQRVRIKSS
ncbi:MAG TPA: DUF192 domain-containing protein [Polyangiaceae bacterium]|nr:DUF192 domain-containing protein [Polyangiaceae bacterium]